MRTLVFIGYAAPMTRTFFLMIDQLDLLRSRPDHLSIDVRRPIPGVGATVTMLDEDWTLAQILFSNPEWLAKLLSP